MTDSFYRKTSELRDVQVMSISSPKVFTIYNYMFCYNKLSRIYGAWRIKNLFILPRTKNSFLSRALPGKDKATFRKYRAKLCANDIAYEVV